MTHNPVAPRPRTRCHYCYYYCCSSISSEAAWHRVPRNRCLSVHSHVGHGEARGAERSAHGVRFHGHVSWQQNAGLAVEASQFVFCKRRLRHKSVQLPTGEKGVVLAPGRVLRAALLGRVTSSLAAHPLRLCRAVENVNLFE